MSARAEVGRPETAAAVEPAGAADRRPRPPARVGPSLAAAVAIGATLATYAWLLAPQLGKPLVYDDVNFALGAQAIARTGLPFGNQGYLLHLYEQRDQWALWHPPMYLYALGLTIKAFGASEWAMRGFGVACQLLTAGLAFDLARRTKGDGDESRGGRAESRPYNGLNVGAPCTGRPIAPARAPWMRCSPWPGVLAVALFLLNPLTVQAALVLDIDNTVLMLLITLYVWVVLRLPPLWSRRTIVGLGLLYAFTLWAKLTTPLLLLAALVFTWLCAGTGLRGVLQALAVGALGWAVFLLSWILITGLAGMPLDYTFIVVYREALESGASTRDRFVSWALFTWGAAPAIIWIGPFFCLLFLAAGSLSLWRLLRGRGLELGDLVPVLGAVIYLAYIMKLAGNFPKYHAAMLPLWAAAAGALVARTAGRPLWGQLAVLAAGAIAAGGWLIWRMPELWESEFSGPLLRLLVVVPAIVGMATAGLWAQIGRVWPQRAVPVTLAALTLAWSLTLNVHQRGLDGSTTYYYGRHGQLEAARALSARLGPDELYIASKEVAWYSHNLNYVDQESWQHVVWDVRGGAFDGTWLGQAIRILAIEVDSHPPIRQTYENLLRPRYRLVGEYGNFLIFERS